MSRALLARAAVLGPLADHPGRALLSALGIALGVALALAVHLINRSAAEDLSAAVRAVAGEADLTLRGPRGGFSEAVYPRVARHPLVAAASPAIQVDARIAGRDEALTLLGVDPLRAREVQPGFGLDTAGSLLDLMGGDAVLLSESAARWLDLAAGGTLAVQVGLKVREFRVAAVIPDRGAARRLAWMDIGVAQWRLDLPGVIHRIDIRARPGADPEQLARDLIQVAPPGVLLTRPEAEGERGASLSRAYRVNLQALSLVALITGGFLVFSTEALSVLRRRRELALLRALGMSRRGLAGWLLAEAAAIGALGGVLGCALGAALAQLALSRLGADLGGGYFRGVEAVLHLSPATLAAFLALGVAAALAGAAAPALEAAWAPPARALRAGDEERALGRLGHQLPGLLLLALGAALALAPAVDGLPLPAYGAMALGLAGAVLLTPWITARVAARLPRPGGAVARLAVLEIQGAPGQASLALAGVVASVALVAAMAVMVSSFRQAVDAWLVEVLPADLYVSASQGGETGFLDPAAQLALAALPGAARVDFVRRVSILPGPDRPAVQVIARPLGEGPMALPLISARHVPSPGEPPAVWVSEPYARLYGAAPGQRITVPLGGQAREFTVAGVWRDYARQAGALVLDLDLYRHLSGDRRASEAWLWARRGVEAGTLAAEVRGSLGAEGIDMSSPGELRRLSLAIFDRTFAVTYALEAAALGVGLAGVSAAFSARAAARRREFGVLRHLGLTRGQVARLLAAEGALLAALGVAVGLALGLAMAAVLVHVVNPQSFHWTMPMEIPLPRLAALFAAMVGAAALTAALGGRAATGDEPVRAVREDW